APASEASPPPCTPSATSAGRPALPLAPCAWRATTPSAGHRRRRSRARHGHTGRIGPSSTRGAPWPPSHSVGIRRGRTSCSLHRTAFSRRPSSCPNRAGKEAKPRCLLVAWRDDKRRNRLDLTHVVACALLPSIDATRDCVRLGSTDSNSENFPGVGG